MDGLDEVPGKPDLAANIRLYAQMRPDDKGLEHLELLQRSLPAGTRLLPRRQLHLTLIHFGKVMDVFRVVSAAGSISLEDYHGLLAGYIRSTEALLPEREFVVQPLGMAGFGNSGRTLVIEYAPAADLARLHARLFRVLRNFLASCGIADVDGFMAADPNFMFASSLRPHITLARGYTGLQPDLRLEPVTLRPLPVVYPPSSR